LNPLRVTLALGLDKLIFPLLSKFEEAWLGVDSGLVWSYLGGEAVHNALCAGGMVELLGSLIKEEWGEHGKREKKQRRCAEGKYNT
jgi:hypothetical protein